MLGPTRIVTATVVVQYDFFFTRLEARSGSMRKLAKYVGLAGILEGMSCFSLFIRADWKSVHGHDVEVWMANASPCKSACSLGFILNICASL